MRTLSRGVTLIELMIVIVVVAILASIAVPSYRNYVLRTHRAEGKTALMAVAAAQEKFYLQNNRYAIDDEIEDAPPGGLGIPATTENGWYTLEIDVDDEVNPQSWTITATSAGVQAADSHCATMSVTSAGAKSATNADCW
ncbi:MAG TPA: type IV pilin protein [Steroidobacteraceae bacterium]|nr:type IV pilin protein [Steroidobacteraceae bacterium]